MDDKDIIGWFSLENGTHIPIRRGETKKDALRKYLHTKTGGFQKSKADNFDEKPKQVKKLIQKGNTYIPVREGEDDETAITRAENTTKPRENDDNDYNNRRESLIKFTQNNREQIDKWVSEYDDETDKRVLDKISKGQGLSLKEYYGYLARRPKEGDIIFGGGKHGEDVRIGKNGKREIIVNYKRKKETNK